MNEIERMLGGVIRICAECGEPFAQFRRGTVQKLCPMCLDRRQNRPSVVLKRELLTVIDDCKVVSLPSEWEEFVGGPHDEGCYRIDVKGRAFGANWDGRIVIYASRPIQVGEVVRLRHMRAEHEVRVVYGERHTSPFTQLKGGPETITVRHKLTASTDDANAKVEIDKYEYIVLEPLSVDVDPLHELVWVTAHTKTTLKGLGRQYWARVEGAPLWQMKIWGGYRSGRAYTTGVLAVVDVSHPLLVIGTGDVEFVAECWPAPAEAEANDRPAGSL